MTCDSCHSHTLLTGLNEGRMLTAIKQRRCTAKSVDITSNGRISTRKVGVSWQLLNWQEKKWQLSKIHSVSILQKKILSPLCWICWIYIFLNLGQHQAFCAPPQHSLPLGHDAIAWHQHHWLVGRAGKTSMANYMFETCQKWLVVRFLKNFVFLTAF